MIHDFIELSLRKRREVLLRHIRKAAGRFGLISPGDHILLGVSGGKDSLVMLDLMSDKSVWWAREVKFTAAYIYAGFEQSEEKKNAIREFAQKRGVDLILEDKPEIARISFSENRPQNPCFICSRMRRKSLVEIADRIGANKIALGHHLEDALQTFLINVFFGRQIAGMMPNQELFKGRFHIIRPLFLIREAQISNFSRMSVFPDLSAKCPMSGQTKREYVKDLLNRLEHEHPGLKRNMFRSLFHVKPDYLLGKYKKTDS